MEPDALSNVNSQSPLAALHKMSVTAGVNAQHYRAVNVAAVLAVLVGLVSALCFFSPVLLFLPFIGVVCGAVALRQIGGSSGTQTGQPLAAAGIALSLGFAGVVLSMQVAHAVQVRHDEGQIHQIIEQLNSDVTGGRYPEGYALFDSKFHRLIPLDLFQRRWQEVTGGYGPIKSLQWNGVAPWYHAPGVPDDVVIVTVIVRFQQNQDRMPMFLRKEDGQWSIDSLDLGGAPLFPELSAKHKS